jgi:uncharacterized protein YyaL (SSP411 family)
VAPVQWLPWSAGAFARARAEDKPVLLSIAAAWCASSRDMDRTTYADPAVAAIVNERFVPIRVDADRRPDISERYTLGGLPTTAFLTANGDIVGGGTYVPVDRMPSVLARVSDAFRSKRDELIAARDARAFAVASSGNRETPSVDDLTRVVFSTFDPEHGGFGAQPKFPLAAPLDLALQLHREAPQPSLAEIATTTLDAMGWGGLYDDVDGGFFRCAARRDWQQPQREKLLDVNAALLRLYLEASQTLEIARYRERAAEVLRYVQTWLADSVDGGWGNSQRADDDYYAATSPDERRSRAAPAIDGVLYAAANAQMASAALRAAEAFDDPSLGEFALKSLERVLIACYSPGAGVAHYVEGRPRVRGLLEDQVAMAAAQLDAFAATGNIVYEMMAQELLHYALRTMWDESGGGFFDRSAPDEQESVGLMRERRKPFVTNCDAARVLRRLSAASGVTDFAGRADMTLAAMGPLAASQGPLAAHYLLAVREGSRPGNQ